ncbi:MAG: hypothetical protein WCI18_06425 [Pseudomonadota bacterium]
MRYWNKFCASRVSKFWSYGLAVALLLSSSGCSRRKDSFEIKAAGNRVGEFKGILATNKIIATRLFKAGELQFALSQYLGSETSVMELLGIYSNVGPLNDFRNGTPNSLNMLLWNIALSGLSSDIAESCGSPQIVIEGSLKIDYNPQFAERLGALCKGPALDFKNEESLLNFWWAVEGFDAPREEYLAWRDFFMSPQSPYAKAASKEVIHAMLKIMFLNPYFLLEN